VHALVRDSNLSWSASLASIVGAAAVTADLRGSCMRFPGVLRDLQAHRGDQDGTETEERRARQAQQVQWGLAA
jgi:hypothetical protein